MCFVLAWNIGFLAIFIVLILSQDIVVRVLLKFLSYTTSLLPSIRALYYVSMKDNAIVDCHLLLHDTSVDLNLNT
jgi:hypothetical protein